MKSLRHQFLIALVVGLGNGQFGLRLLKQRLGQLVVQLDQQLAAPNFLAIAEVQPRHTTADFRLEHHALP